MTASEYLNSCRIEKARQLLTTKNQSSTILDIAMKCGFDSSQYFATVFKKKTGMSPSQYQENTLAEQRGLSNPSMTKHTLHFGIALDTKE